MAPILDNVDLVLPVHNEAGSIGGTLKEFYAFAQEAKIPVRFVVCEDGSTDNTVEILQELALELPILLITDSRRKGYSRAVVDGFRATTAPYIAFIDSDGQCAPEDFPTLIAKIADNDLVMGYRNPRADHWIRICMSRSFHAVYSLFFNVPVRDPSCPYLLIKKDALEKVLKGNPGILRQGFWWEFIARAVGAGLKIEEVPVSHRQRTSGETQVYRPSKVLQIGYEHILGLFKLRQEIRQINGC